MNIHRQEMKKSRISYLFILPYVALFFIRKVKSQTKEPKTDSKSLLFSFDILP